MSFEAGKLFANRAHVLPRPFAFRLGYRQIMELLSRGMLLDGRGGGLVLGPSHEEGNIFLLSERWAGSYEILGAMEGGEYLLSHKAYLLFKDRMNEINNRKYPTTVPEKISFTDMTRIINAFGRTTGKVIFIDRRGQFIVNKSATSRCLSELVQLSSRAEDVSSYLAD
jgi:hypothetical protein